MTDELVRTQEGLVDGSIFSDQVIYEQELTRVFGKCWLFLGHESQIPRDGAYLTTYMAEDSVIVVRDVGGKIRVLLNKCRHRGNQVCLFDRGNARAFSCSYHGWTYTTDGKLAGVPSFEEAYFGALDTERWGLVEVPRVETRGGLIFGCWDPEAMSLDAYLGDMGWYLDTYVTAEYLGGLEVIRGVQKYVIPGNWKLPSDNFAGDHYHFPVTHGSLLKLSGGQGGPGGRRRADGIAHEVVVGHQTGVPHTAGQLRRGLEIYEDDLQRAAELGPEAVEWIEYRYQRLQDRLKDRPAKPYSFNRGHIFPHFSMIGVLSPLQAKGLIVWHPRGPHQSEAWQLCAVEKEAPASLKWLGAMTLLHGQSAAGLVGPDDNENFERMTDNLQSTMAVRWPFNYEMGLGRDASYPGRDTWAVESLPGLVGFHTTEMGQREFYRYWQHLMANSDGRNGHT